MRIENPIAWLKSKRAVSDNPVSWLSPERHYKKFEETVVGLNDEQLKQERERYNHNTRNDLLITGSAVAAEVSTATILASYVDPRVILLLAGPATAAVYLVGRTRGIIRDGEKGILQEEIDRRLQPASGTVYSAQE